VASVPEHDTQVTDGSIPELHICRQVLDSLYQFIGLLDTSGTILYLNRAPVKASGRPARELLGIPFWEGPWWQGGDKSLLKREIARACGGGVCPPGSRSSHKGRDNRN